MKPKPLILLTWIFYLLGKEGSDQVWLFCALLSAFLTLCSFFYLIEHRHKKPKR